MGIKEKVLKKYEKKFGIHICNHIPQCDGYDKFFPEGFSYLDLKTSLEFVHDKTLAEVEKVIDEIQEDVDDGFHPIEKYVNSEELKILVRGK